MKALKKIIITIFSTIMTIFFMCILIFIYSCYVEPKLLSVKNIEFNSKDNVQNSKRIEVAQISDIHLGKYYSIEQLEKLVDKVNKQNPDIIVFTGDLFDNISTFDRAKDVSPILSKLSASIGKFAVFGNHDYGGGAEKAYKNIMKESGFKLLVNEKYNINLNSGKNLSILGLDDGLLGKPNINQTIKNIETDSYNLLLLHEPDLADKFLDYNIDFILSGHSHGGQVKIPFWGEIVTPPLAQKYKDGLYELNTSRNTNLYVNSGIGNTKLPFRFLNVPEISIFELNI
ncbi:metallophosphoesterase [Clostridium sp. CTA-5]